jgi:hypothetical protein
MNRKSGESELTDNKQHNLSAGTDSGKELVRTSVLVKNRNRTFAEPEYEGTFKRAFRKSEIEVIPLTACEDP